MMGGMKTNPSDAMVMAWDRLVRCEAAVIRAVEAEVRAAGLPPIAWHAVLRVLSQAEAWRMRPYQIEEALRIPQYRLSRLLDGLEAAGFVQREAAPEDGRGQYVAMTPDGCAAQRKIWPVYAAAIEKHVGTKLSEKEAQQLSRLLGKIL